ncbi:unnamed protein product [Chrysoparadoxa australica]
MLWVDKYRPTTLAKIELHPGLSQRLKAMSEDGEIPHLLFYGPSGAGKKTRILALLKEIFGPGAGKVRLEHRTFKTPSNRSIEITTVASSYHIEISAADAGIYDRFVIQDIIKEIAGSQSLTSTMTSVGSGEPEKRKKATFKVVLLMGVDRLTQQAQAALRRTMEKYTQSCRLILCCNSSAKVIEPVRSRCLGVRVPAPTVNDICQVLQSISKKESIALPEPLAARMAEHSGRNLRKAVLMLESCKVQSYPFKTDQPVPLADWEMYIQQIAKALTTEQNPQCLLETRAKLYELLANCIPADMILRTLSKELHKLTEDDIRHEVAHWSAFYEARLHQGSKEIFHLEAFVAKFLSLYKVRASSACLFFALSLPFSFLQKYLTDMFD